MENRTRDRGYRFARGRASVTTRTEKESTYPDQCRWHRRRLRRPFSKVEWMGIRRLWRVLLEVVVLLLRGRRRTTRDFRSGGQEFAIPLESFGLDFLSG